MQKFRTIADMTLENRFDTDSIVITSVSRKKGNIERISRAVYFPKETSEFIEEHMSGSFSSCVFSLVEYAIKDLLMKNKKLISKISV